MIPLLAASLLVGGMLSSLSAEATTVLHFGIDELVQESGLIVEGTVLNITTSAGTADRVPTTTYEVCDLDLIVGDYDRSCLDIEVAGGDDEAGGHGHWAGMPTLEVKQRYVLFLLNRQEYTSPFVGWWQGVYQVVDGPRGRAILSNGGYPVQGIEQGNIVTRRNIKRVRQPTGMIELVTDEDFEPVDASRAAQQAMTRQDFVDAIQMTATARMLAGRATPERLPDRWTSRNARDWPTVSAPAFPAQQEVTP